MMATKKENATETYSILKEEYLSLKALLNVIGVNMIDIDLIMLPDLESLFQKLEETKETISQNFLLSLLTYSLGLIPVTRLKTLEK